MTTATAAIAQDEEVTPGDEPTEIELLDLPGDVVEVLDTDIAELAIALEEIRLDILGNTEYIDALRTDLIRGSVQKNKQNIGALERTVARLNVDKLRTRVQANQAVLKEVTKQHLALAARAKDTRLEVTNLRRRLEALEAEVWGE